jgi:hypothetical protein
VLIIDNMLTNNMNFRGLFLVVMVALGLLACTTYRYEYIAPPTESGKTCAVQCMNTKNVCYSGMQAQSQNNVYQCQQNNHYSYQNCVAHAQSRDDVKKCNPNPQYCSTSVNYWQCDESYRQCFATCGGTVHMYKNE